MCLLDDLHWADESSLQLLLHIAPHLASMRLLVIGTYRDVELDVKRPFAKALESLLRQRLATRIALRRLTQSGVEQMISAMSRSTPPSGLSAAIFRETEGNPFFVEEVFQHLAEEGKLFDEAGAWRPNLRVDSLDVPESVRLVIGRRLDRLGDEARRVLTAGAVIGRSFALDILQAIVDAPDEAVLDALEEAEHAQLVASQPAGREVRYGFVHELIRTTLVSGLSLPRRQRLHLKTADAIERLRASSLDSHVSVLAHHLYQAGAAADRDRAARFLSLAGRRAIDAAAFEEALELCDDLVSLELPDTHPLVAEARERRGQGMRGLHHMLDASAEFERALDQYAARRDDDGVMRSASAAAACYRSLTRLSDAARVVRYGLSRLAPSALGQHALLLASLAVQETVPSSLPAATQEIADAEAMARRQNDPAVLARVLVSKNFHLYLTSRFIEAIETGREAQRLLEHLSTWDRADALWILGLSLLISGSKDHEALLADAETTAARVGHQVALWAADRWRHWVGLLRSGDVSAFLRQTEAALERWPNVWPFVLHVSAAVSLTYLGRFDEAEAHVARGASEQTGESPWNGILEAASAGISALAGRADEALARLRGFAGKLPTIGAINVQGAWGALVSTVLSTALVGSREECGALYPLARACVDNHSITDFALLVGPVNAQLAAGIAAHAAGLPEQAREHFETAWRQATDFPQRLLQPAVQYWHGRMLRESGDASDHARGRVMLESAAADFHRLEMIVHARLAERALAT